MKVAANSNSFKAKATESPGLTVVLGDQKICLTDRYQESPLADLKPSNWLPFAFVQLGTTTGLVAGGLTGLRYGGLVGEALGSRNLGGAVGSIIGGALGAGIGLKASWFVTDQLG